MIFAEAWGEEGLLYFLRSIVCKNGFLEGNNEIFMMDCMIARNRSGRRKDAVRNEKVLAAIGVQTNDAFRGLT
jgi:hypothetical protein